MTSFIELVAGTPVVVTAAQPAAEAAWWSNPGVWTIVAAFAGFTVGNLIKFGFDQWLESTRRKHRRRGLALALRAELMLISKTLYMRTRLMSSAFLVLSNSKNEEIELSRILGAFEGIKIPRSVFDCSIEDLGVLGADLSANIVHVYGMLEYMSNLKLERGIKANKNEAIIMIESALNGMNTVWGLLGDLVRELSDAAGVQSPAEEKVDWQRELHGYQKKIEDLAARLRQAREEESAM